MAEAGFETLKALIVEDNSHMRSLLRALLNSIGIREIAEAANGQTALILLRERKSDLVLTDLAMKPMDGLDFTRRVRNDDQSPNPFVPIIMITGHTDRRRHQLDDYAGPWRRKDDFEQEVAVR